MAMYVNKDNNILVEEGVSLDDWTKKTELEIQELRTSTQVGKYVNTIPSTLFVPYVDRFKTLITHNLGTENVNITVRDLLGNDLACYTENNILNKFEFNVGRIIN